MQNIAMIIPIKTWIENGKAEYGNSYKFEEDKELEYLKFCNVAVVKSGNVYIYDTYLLLINGIKTPREILVEELITIDKIYSDEFFPVIQKTIDYYKKIL